MLLLRVTLCFSLALTGCATSARMPATVTYSLPDGTQVKCPRPDPALFSEERAQGLSAAFPGIVESLVTGGSTSKKVAAILPVAATPNLLEVLGYRVCLAYGQGVITSATYQDWLRNVLPALERSVRSARE